MLRKLLKTLAFSALILIGMGVLMMVFFGMNPFKKSGFSVRGC